MTFDIDVNRSIAESLKQLDPTRGPYSARDLGILKALDAAVEEAAKEAAKNGSVHSSANFKVNLSIGLQDRALIALPVATAKLLEGINGGSDLALEMVRRNLIDFVVLSRALYQSTEDTRKKDPGLQRLYQALNPVVELHGALSSAGIDVDERDWARTLVSQVPNLRRLRSTPWYEIALLLKIIVYEDAAEDQTRDKKDTDDDEAFDPKKPWKNPPTRAEIRVIEELYAIGEGAPAIRQQVLNVRLTLDVADQLEDMGIYNASTMTQEDTRRLTELATEQLEATASSANALSAAKEASAGTTQRALPVIAAALPTILRAVPTLSNLSKLTSLGGTNSISNMGNVLNALSSNTGTGGIISNNGGSVSGLVTGIKEVQDLIAPGVEANAVAIEQEKILLQATLDNVRLELENVSVAGVTQEELEKAQVALDKAKAQVAPIEGWQNRIEPGSAATLQASLQEQRLLLGDDNLGTGAYSSNEELVAKASGGSALYGMNFFATSTDMVLKPYAPIIATPSYVEMTGAVENFEANVWQSTSVDKAAAFHSTATHAGISVAEKSIVSLGASASFRSPFASGQVSTSNETVDESENTEEMDEVTESSSNSTTSTATVIEYIKCPMKSFRIPMTRMQLSEDAYKSALHVNTIRDAEEFIDAYGSHVSNGRQELGGIFFSTITVTSQEKLSTTSMVAAASSQSNTLKAQSTEVNASVSGGFGRFSASASTSFGKATSVGVTKVNSTATSSSSEQSTLDAIYSQYVRCTGPRAPTPEVFADALFNDNSTWAVMDRGPIEALLPITRVLENTMETLGVNHPDFGALQKAVNFITAAWRIRAKRWGDVLLDENNQGDSIVPSAVLDLLRTAYPISQGVVQELIDSVYNALWFVDPGFNVGFDYDTYFNVKNQSLKVSRTVAQAIVDAAAKATGGNGAPARFSFLDAEDVQVYVEDVMGKREEANRLHFIEAMAGTAEPDALDIIWKNKRVSVRYGRFNVTKENKNTSYFDSLEKWEQAWILKHDKITSEGKVWEAADWEVFQREHLKAGDSSDFLVELERVLEEKFPTEPNSGIIVRVVNDTGLGLRNAVLVAAAAMNEEDWVIFEKIWDADNNPEEANRVMEVVEDYLALMRKPYMKVSIERDVLNAATVELNNAKEHDKMAASAIGNAQAAVDGLQKELDELLLTEHTADDLKVKTAELKAATDALASATTTREGPDGTEQKIEDAAGIRDSASDRYNEAKEDFQAEAKAFFAEERRFSD